MLVRVLLVCMFVLGVVGCAQQEGTSPTEGQDEAAKDARVETSPDEVGDADAGVVVEGQAESVSPDVVVDAISTQASRCQVEQLTMTCPHRETLLKVGQLQLPRKVYWQVPLGKAPAAGWPVVIIFQGSLFSSAFNWVGVKGGLGGMYYQAMATKQLLDAGFAVLTPVARVNGATFWDTNIPPFSMAWSTAPDHLFMLEIFRSIEQGTFGSLDAKRLYATGISSGGYMTSRMAVSYPGKFRALAIHSASYATCSGPLCQVPTSLPKDHPPTLFLHGKLDFVVPYQTMVPYEEALRKAGHPTRVVLDDKADHAWFAASPDAILAWFLRYP